MNTIGDRLREERERLGYSQVRFAEIGGVQRRAQVRYEADERSPDGRYFEELAKYGVDVGYVITGRSSAAYPHVVQCNQLGIAENPIFSDQQRKLIEMFDKLDDVGRAWLFGILAERIRIMDLENQVAELTKNRKPKK